MLGNVACAAVSASMFGVSPSSESENRLDTVPACEVAYSAVDRGFPAGAPGGRDADWN